MNEINEQESIQEEAGTQSAAASAREMPGRRLREQRESNHLSREEVARHLRLDVQLIKALEGDDYSRLPSPAYICGYLRSYARLLKLPEDEIVKAYSRGEQINSALIPSSVNIKPKKTVNTGLIKTVVIIIIAVLIGGGLYLVADKFNIFSADRTPKSSQLTVPVAPVAKEQQTKQPSVATETKPDLTAAQNPQVQQPSPPASKAETSKVVVEQLPTPKTEIPDVTPVTPTGMVSSPKVTTKADAQGTVQGHAQDTTQSQQTKQPAQTSNIRLHFLGDSWVEVTDNTGKRLVYHLIEKNTDLNLEGEPPFTILLGNAPQVQVFYKGKEFDHTRYHRDEIAYFHVGAK